jgi:transposase-like protein
MAVSFKGAHFPKEVILTGVRWYAAYPLSTRQVEELMLERGVHGPPDFRNWLDQRIPNVTA